VTDGATRMLVLFYFYNLGYTPFAVASLFIFYEVFGILTNLFGGYIGALSASRRRCSSASARSSSRCRCSPSRRSPGWSLPG
jgi:hypothetical protein